MIRSSSVPRQVAPVLGRTARLALAWFALGCSDPAAPGLPSVDAASEPPDAAILSILQDAGIADAGLAAWPSSEGAGSQSGEGGASWITGDGGAECVYGGAEQPHGAQFLADDGCNTCFCADGTVLCSMAICREHCGGLTGHRCDTGSWCLIAGCGLLDGAGFCVDQPDVCTGADQPVCGCDGKTYRDRCQVAAQGLMIASEGACPDP
jgi:hypothetical protein